MNAFVRIHSTLVILLSIFICNWVQAADAEQSYAIKGAGVVSCERYVTALDEKSKEYISFAAWIDGYITAFNQFQPETFDIAPWQSTLLLTQALGRHCKKNPETRFFKTLMMMLQALNANRLQKRSDVVKIRSNNKTLMIYKEVVKMMQTRLNKLNGTEIKVDGVFGSSTEAELRRFQKQSKISITGVPDQITLQMLFQ